MIRRRWREGSILLSFLLFYCLMVGKYALICSMEIQKIHVVVHIFSGFALFTESECIAELNPSASCWPLTRFTNKRVQIKILSILKLDSFESLAGNDFSEQGTQAEAHCGRNLNRQLWSIRRKISHRCSRNFQCSQTGCLTTLFVKNKPRKLVSSLVGCLLLFLKIYVPKIGGNCRGKYQDNGKIEISVF